MGCREVIATPHLGSFEWHTAFRGDAYPNFSIAAIAVREELRDRVCMRCTARSAARGPGILVRHVITRYTLTCTSANAES